MRERWWQPHPCGRGRQSPAVGPGTDRAQQQPWQHEHGAGLTLMESTGPARYMA